MALHKHKKPTGGKKPKPAKPTKKQKENAKK